MLQQQPFLLSSEDQLSAEDAIALVQAISTLSTSTAAAAIFNNAKLRNSLGNLFAAKFVEVSRISAHQIALPQHLAGVHGSAREGLSGRHSAGGAASAARPLHSSIVQRRRKQETPVRPETTWLSNSDDDDDEPVLSASSSPSVAEAPAMPPRHLGSAQHQAKSVPIHLPPEGHAQPSTTDEALAVDRAPTDSRDVTILISDAQGNSDDVTDEAMHSSYTCALPANPKPSNRKLMFSLRGSQGSWRPTLDQRVVANGVAVPGGGGRAPLGIAAAAATMVEAAAVALVCELCGRRFSKPSALMQHRRWHTGEKPAQPYSCEQCGRGFSSRNSLHIHHAIHTGEKRYACEVCGKRFSTQTYLWHHRAVHSDARPYSCEYCGCDFKMRSSLNNHLARRHAVFTGSTTAGGPTSAGSCSGEAKPGELVHSPGTGVVKPLAVPANDDSNVVVGQAAGSLLPLPPARSSN